MDQLARVNAQIDEATDGHTQQGPIHVSPPDWSPLVSYLRELHTDVGKTSARKIAENSGGMVSHTTVSEVLRGTRMPSWKLLRVIGRELGADDATLKRIWVNCQVQPAVPEE